jgi:hypothetical protein
MYHYIQSEPGLWTVGTGSPKEKTWEPESDHTSQQEAANRVIVLNGGTVPDSKATQNNIQQAYEIMQMRFGHADAPYDPDMLQVLNLLAEVQS